MSEKGETKEDFLKVQIYIYKKILLSLFTHTHTRCQMNEREQKKVK